MERIDVERAGATYVIERHGRGRPVVLAHGLLCSARLFDDVVPLLAADGLELIVPTFRDHPGSGESPRAWSLTDLVHDLVAVLDACGHERAIFAGFSMGGMASMRLALRHPERVAGLALLSTSAAPERPRARARFTLLAAGARLLGPRPQLLGEAVKILFHPEYVAREPSRVAGWRDDVASLAPASVQRAVHAVAWRADLRAELGGIDVPTTVLVGSDDVATSPGRAREIVERVAHARLVQVPGIAHSTPMEAPDAVAECIRGVVRAVDGP